MIAYQRMLEVYGVAYLVVSLMSMLHVMFNWLVLKQEAFDLKKGPKELLRNATKMQAFTTTKPFHPVYNLLVFPIACWVLYRGHAMMLSSVFELSVVWIVVSVLLDIVIWVVIPHPWHMTWKELFVDYQPWLNMSYLVIFLMPYMVYFIQSL